MILNKRFNIPQFKLLIIVIPFFLFHPQPSAIGQNPKIPEVLSIEIHELERTIDLLENPEEVEKLATQLKALLEAKKQLIEEAREAEKLERMPPNLFRVYESFKIRISSTVRKVISDIRSLPLGYNRLKAYLSEKENLQRFLSFFIKFFIALLAGFILWLGLRKYTKRLEEKLTWKEPVPVSKKIGRVFFATFFKIYPWIGLYFFGYLLLLLFPLHEKAGSIILYGLFALIPYFGLKNLFYFILSPEISGQRVLPLKNELSQYIFIWLQRVLLFSLWMYFLIMPSQVLNRPALASILYGIYKVGLVIMLAIILAQWKNDIEKALSLTLKEETPRWRNNLKKVFNYIIGKGYLIVIIYIGFLVTLSILSLSKIYNYLLYSSIKSVMVILGAAGLSILWGLLFKKLFLVRDTLTQKYPELEEWVNRYVHYIGKAGHLIVFLFTLLTLLDIWGVDTYEFIASNVNLGKAMIRIPLIILFALFSIQVAYFLIGKLGNQAKSRMIAAGTSTPIEVEKRVATLGRIFKRAVWVIIAAFATMMVLAELGFDIKPILAGAGIVGLAVGFGAQNLVRDILSGLFLIFENRIRVGDVAVINGTGGLVEQVNLRTTALRGLDGTVHSFPNGAITALSNMTYEFSYYVFDVGVAYKEDVDRVIDVLKGVGEEIMKDEMYKTAILEPLEILGVDQFADSAVMIKARIKTAPIKQWFVGREMNRRIKKRFDEVGIEIPFPHRSFYFGEASKSIRVQLEGFKEQREELKELIREVFQEGALKPPAIK